MKNPNLAYKPKREAPLFHKKLGRRRDIRQLRSNRVALAIVPVAIAVFGMPNDTDTFQIRAVVYDSDDDDE